MAEDDGKKAPESTPPTPPAAPALSDAERAELEELRAMHAAREAELARAAESAPKSATIPGGAYLVNDILVNAEGKAITKDGKVKE